MSIQSKVDDLVSAISTDLMKFLLSALKNRPWVFAWSDVRASPGTPTVRKLRIRSEDGTTITDMSAPIGIAMQIRELWSAKDALPDDKRWYGFKLTVYPEGRSEVEYNYDPNCVEDPAFLNFES